QNATQALYSESLNEPHAAHVSGQIVNLNGSLADPMTVFLLAAIQAQALHARYAQIPFIKGLLIHRPNAPEAFLFEIQSQVAGNKSSRPSDDDQIIFSQLWVSLNDSFAFHASLQFIDGFGTRVPIAISLSRVPAGRLASPVRNEKFKNEKIIALDFPRAQ